MRLLLCAGLSLLLNAALYAQSIVSGPAVDSDHDGLTDVIENQLLQQFTPQFMISGDDCSKRPAQFTAFQSTPIVEADNGTIYGQAFPYPESPGHPDRLHVVHPDQVELHYYHLWRRDCGEIGHDLDAEHVSVLLSRDSDAGDQDHWKALYWYAAAHEDTVCDASQITRASILNAESSGPKIWISRGKHASFLNETICTHGCGGDRCPAMEPLLIPAVINIGELSAPMNGALWTDATVWPLAAKLARSDFAPSRTAHADRLSAPGIAWANPEKRPVQAAILGTNDGIGGASTGLRSTGDALDTANSTTGNALSKTFRRVGKALRKTVQKTADAFE
jgi:hypothetical protein